MKRAKAPTIERKRLDVIEYPSSAESTRFGTDAWTGAVRHAGVGERLRPSHWRPGSHFVRLLPLPTGMAPRLARSMGGPMTLAIGWPRDPGENVGRRPHVPRPSGSRDGRRRRSQG